MHYIINTIKCSRQSFLVAHIAKVTNMRVLTPLGALDSCNFLAANLYARSIFGEDALVNISVENKADGSIRGHIRIRAKTQGVALSLPLCALLLCQSVLTCLVLSFVTQRLISK
jgi:coatomer subunit beta